MSKQSILIKHCQLISDGINMQDAAILIQNGIITDISDASANRNDHADEIIDATNCYAMPGFIDIHTHGTLGCHAGDSGPESIATIAEHKLSEGVTTFCASTVTMPTDELLTAVENIAKFRQQNPYSKIAGLHLEGPFISPKKLGGQNGSFISEPDIKLIKRLNKILPVKIVSFAPELPGGYKFSEQLSELDIIPSAAHTNANYQELQNARNHGLKHLTHFCNQMTPLHHRDIGAVGAGLIDDELTIEIICDKIHLCPEMIKLIFKFKPLEKIILITDANYLSGLPDGEHELRGMRIAIKAGIIRIAGTDTLCGSGLRYNIALKNVAEVTGLPLEKLIRTTALNQALALNLNKVGKIEPGFIADIAILDREFNVKQLLIDGIMKF